MEGESSLPSVWQSNGSPFKAEFICRISFLIVREDTPKYFASLSPVMPDTLFMIYSMISICLFVTVMFCLLRFALGFSLQFVFFHHLEEWIINQCHENQ